MPDLGNDLPTIRERRTAHLESQRPYLPFSSPLWQVKEEDLQIPIRDGEKLPVRIYSPDSSLIPPSGSPMYVAFHEGGWIMGDLSDEEINCRAICKEFGAVCVNVAYRSGPNLCISMTPG
jgi:acetyl esterase/lipase